MKTSTRLSLLIAVTFGVEIESRAHGPGERHSAAVVSEDVVDGSSPLPNRPVNGGGETMDKSFETPVDVSRRVWGASLTTGWESRHVHYGIDETGNYGAYTTELSAWIGDFAVGVWSGFGTGNAFEEWDFTASYNVDAGPVFVIPGYNFRYNPGFVEPSGAHEDESESEHEEEGHDEHAEESHGTGHAAHSHNVYNHELFVVLGTDAIPYVTPSTVFIWNLSDSPGGFLEFRLDGEIPIYRDIISLQPYALLGLNFGYNGTDAYGWNNFQFGLEASWRLSRVVSVFAGVNYSVAMTALREIDQDNVVWANTGVSFSF